MKHLAMMWVRATSLKSLSSIAVACFCTGTIVTVLKWEGMTAWSRNVLKISVNTPDSSLALICVCSPCSGWSTCY